MPSMKFTKQFLFLFLGVLLMTSLGCDNENDNPKPSNCIDGTGSVVSEDIVLPGNITGFEMLIAADIVLTQGLVQEVRIEAQQNIIDNILTEVSNGNWKIEYDRCVDNHEDVTIYITLPTLKEIVFTGVGDLSSTNSFENLDDPLIVFTGVGTVTLDLSANSITSIITGVATFNLSGTVENQNVTFSGVGNYNAFTLNSKTCDIRVTGSGDCKVLVTDALDVTITGSGDVYYKGMPSISVTITGSGALIDAN